MVLETEHVENIQLVLNLIRVGCALAAFMYASYTDWKIREVEDHVWIVLFIIGMGGLIIELAVTGGNILHFLFLIPITTSCAYALVGYPEPREALKGSKEDLLWTLIYFISIVIIPLFLYFEVYKVDEMAYPTKILLPVLIVTVLYYLLYYGSIGGISLIHGGADAKGLIALSVLIPAYPLILSLPILDVLIGSRMFIFVPPSFSIFINASLFSLLIMLIFIPVKNIMNKDFGLPMFFGYKMDIDKVMDSHVWLMQKCDKDLNQKIVYFPSGKPGRINHIKRLKEVGETRVWVAPKIPFMIPLLGGIILLVLFGNLLFEIVFLIAEALIG